MSLTGNASGSTLRGTINKLRVTRGYSAYEVAVINGFSGTEEEWLESLKGEKGDRGDGATEDGVVLKDRVTGTMYEVYMSNGKLTMNAVTESEE